jgi:hypothetical protein
MGGCHHRWFLWRQRENRKVKMVHAVMGMDARASLRWRGTLRFEATRQGMPRARLEIVAGSASRTALGHGPWSLAGATKFPAKVWAKVWVWPKPARASAEFSALNQRCRLHPRKRTFVGANGGP